MNYVQPGKKLRTPKVKNVIPHVETKNVVNDRNFLGMEVVETAQHILKVQMKDWIVDLTDAHPIKSF